MVHNTSLLCPSFSTILRNTYGALIRLFVTDKDELASTEGTTEDDPLVIAMYALAVTPLINSLCHHQQLDVSQAWFVADATAAGQLTPLLQWWKQIFSLGPLYGYHPNATKPYLIVKP